MTTSNNSKQDENEFQAFRRWLLGLERDELLQAMQVTFPVSTSCVIQECHEYHLLLEIVKLQSPPPTPVHPRAMGYRPASQYGPQLDYETRKRPPRMFQLSPQSTPTTNTFIGRNTTTSSRLTQKKSSQPTTRYDVMARKQVAPWGQAWGVGCTRQQQEADQQLIQGTRILRNGSSSNKTESAQLYFEPLETGSSRESIVQMLHIASRGYFWQHHKPPSPSSKEFFMPWLTPTDRWFSLSLYLSSRYQVALWESFVRQKATSSSITPSSSQPEYKTDIWERAFPNAMRLTLIRALQEERANNNALHLRDSLVWKILCDADYSYDSNSTDWKTVQAFWSSTPLLEVQSPRDQLRIWLTPHLQTSLAKEMEAEILQETKHPQATQPNAKKKKRKRKKNAKRSAPSTVLPQEKRPESSSERTEEDITTNTNYSFPATEASPNERNKNIILVLALLENIVEQVFETVGLDPTPLFVPEPSATEKGKGKPKPGTTIQIQGFQKKDHTKKPKPKKKLGPIASPKRDSPKQQEQLRKLGVHHPAIESSFSSSKAPSNYSSLQNNLPFGHTDDKIIRAFGSVGGNQLYVGPRDRRMMSHQMAAPNLFPAPYDATPTDFYRPMNNDGSGTDQFSFGTTTGVDDDGLDEQWPFVNRYQARERSILAEFFRSQEARFDREQKLMAGSTAASIASSINMDVSAVADTDDGDKASNEELTLSNGMDAIAEADNTNTPGDISVLIVDTQDDNLIVEEATSHDQSSTRSVSNRSHSHGESASVSFVDNVIKEDDKEFDEDEDEDGRPSSPHQAPSSPTIPIDTPDCRSPSPEAPITPPPTLSPILVSLADLRDLKEGSSLTRENFKTLPERFPLPKNARSYSATPTIPLDTPDCRSPSPEAPITPPPTMSPILVSLADLRDLKKSSSLTRENFKTLPERFARPKMARSYSAAVASGSLPSSPIPNPNGLTASWSREDLRIASFRDDHYQNIKQRRQAQPQRPSEPYKAAAVKSLAKPIASSKVANLDFRAHYLEVSMRRGPPRESCAQSETAVEGHEDEPHWQPGPRNPDMVTRDETTTITSALSHQREPEELSLIREERNSFRDLCLTLGAEVSKLKAMLASQKASAVAPPLDYQDGYHPHQVYGQNSFDPNAMPPFFHGMQRGQRVGAMSDAGLHRGGDHESQVSEDEVYDAISKARADNVRRMSSSATILGSESSVDFNSRSIAPQEGLVGVTPVYDAFSANAGLQSRLTKDILRFLSATSNQIKKQDGKKKMAIERFSRLVNTLWPRAQVKLYGSHVSGLCLPSSDLDFVVCLPAVHKNAPALAPGVLEGRNAINETSQKLLARALKGESWIDPRSIKLIERTVVPVIKVSTKDARARMIQLDISFDSNDHHGLEAIQMVAQVVDELPLIRPLVLVLKQFLLDRGLLTSYTGGLSSYCLFLMVARYLQEQPSSCGDCGSLLMGILDFYGNCFDPRATGISVRRRQYFARPMNYVPVRHQAAGQPMWTPSPHQQHANPGPPVATAAPHEDFMRRNSFSEGSVDGVRRTPPSSLSRPPRFQPAARFVPHSVPPPNSNNEQANPYGHGRPFTFDPLFVEDPLSAGNNVGRNAFRVFQVQRAFSDAHRALVASLEWDIHSSGELNDVDYPLLKCLLQSEDVLYEL